MIPNYVIRQPFLHYSHEYVSGIEIEYSHLFPTKGFCISTGRTEFSETDGCRLKLLKPKARRIYILKKYIGEKVIW